MTANNPSGPPGDGSISAFNRNWQMRPESTYTHFTRCEPQNQIQLAFRQNWLNFARLMRQAWGDRDWRGLRSLEVGAGRGTMSLYFAEAGFDCTMVDTSEAIIEVGQRIFAEQNLPGRFLKGDALALDFPDAGFDVVFSIGLLEHFERPTPVIAEQVRMLAPNGVLLVYVVPDRPSNVQADYAWINEVLKVHAGKATNASAKEEVYRSDYASPIYLDAMRKSGLLDCGASGVYPLPMISPSIDFPFTLNPSGAERVLVQEFSRRLRQRERENGQPGWLCDESYGQAFLVWGRKN
jgi:ubiquinone/menaquinone biosynthesis C-methylase UbiE